MRLLRGAAATVRQDNMQHTTYKDAAAYAALPNRVGLSTVTVEASQPASPSIPVPFFASALFRATTLGLGLRPCHIFLGTGARRRRICPGTGLTPHFCPGTGRVSQAQREPREAADMGPVQARVGRRGARLEARHPQVSPAMTCRKESPAASQGRRLLQERRV
jgi:hypothetical protein